MPGLRSTMYGCRGMRATLKAVGCLLTLTAIALLPASCSVTTPPDDEGVTDVLIVGFAFSPKTVTIQQGDTVRWTNAETLVSHTSTSGDPEDDDAGALWNSGTLLPGQSFTHTFDEVGEFPYFCEPHKTLAAMRDALVVVEAAE